MIIKVYNTSDYILKRFKTIKVGKLIFVYTPNSEIIDTTPNLVPVNKATFSMITEQLERTK